MSNRNMKVFMYKDEPYMMVIPAKRLFNSTMIHEVITRGDFFAVNLLTSIFTILPNGANHAVGQTTHTEQPRVAQSRDLNKDLFTQD